MGYVKVERRRFIDKIARDFRRAIRKVSEEEAIIYAMDENPKCSWIEFGKAIFPLFANNDALVRRIWTERKRQFNINPDFPDDEIIGVTFEVLGIDNKTRLEVYEQFAIGKPAAQMASFCRLVAKHWIEKAKRLEDKAQDPQLLTRLRREHRRIKRIVEGH